MIKTQPIDIKQFLSWVAEAQIAHQTWRRDSWEDYEFRDGKQWSQAAINIMNKKNINPITVNRVFPILNLMMGYFINNQQDIVAKGRTKQDNELGQVMSEAITFIKDQNKAAFKIIKAFNDQITTGFGSLKIGLNQDPRREPITIKYYPWYSIWWDPYSDPWLDKSSCRYVFSAQWKNLSDLQSLFPEQEKEIEERFEHLTSDSFVPDVYDEGTQVEDYRKYVGSSYWANAERKRVRPVEMWYTVFEKGWFAEMPNGRVIDLDPLPPIQQVSIVKQAKRAVSAMVRKTRVAIFLDNLLLHDGSTTFVHDEYPWVPFVGYLDRYDQPFGIPRQIKEQGMEVNKRRSMALALISNRRVITEQGAATDLNKLYDEANRTDGLIVLRKGKKKAFEIQEMSNLAPAQVSLMEQSEKEIQEIAGANEESLGYDTRVQSGVALEKKQQQQATITASLFENARFSLKNMGEKITALVQDNWTEEKVLRVVDRVTGVESFVNINQPVYDDYGQPIEIRNDITQATFDINISTKPMTDTMREKNMELIFSAINKAPAEAIGPLLNLGLEISDLPNKDLLLKQIRAATGVTPIDDQLTASEREEQERQEAEETRRRQSQEYELEIKAKEAETAETVAKSEKLRAEALAILKTAHAKQQEADQKGYQLGQELVQDILDRRAEREAPNDTTAGSSVREKSGKILSLPKRTAKR